MLHVLKFCIMLSNNGDVEFVIILNANFGSKKLH